MKKKVLAAMLVATMALSMAACGGEEVTEQSSVSVSESQTLEQVAESVEESKSEEQEGNPLDNDERYNFAFDKKLPIPTQDPLSYAGIYYGSINGGERDGWAAFDDNADPQQAYYLFVGSCTGKFLVDGENGLEMVEMEIASYDDALYEIETGLDYWDYEISYGQRFPWDFKFEVDSQEEIKVNDYEMCKYKGKVVYQTNDLDESQNKVEKKDMVLHIVKLEGEYVFFMMLGQNEQSEENAKIVEYFADKSAQTFYVE